MAKAWIRMRLIATKSRAFGAVLKSARTRKGLTKSAARSAWARDRVAVGRIRNFARLAD